MAKPLVIPLDVRLMGWAANSLFAVLLVMGLGTVAWWVARQPVWTLTGITVLGDVEHQSAVTLRTHLGSRLEGTFLTVDLREVQRLFEAAPWVRQARVQREFPNRLRVVLEEHEAVAWWGEAGSGRLVNRYGEVFEANPEDVPADRWSELAGPADRAAQVYALYLALAPVFERMGRELDRLELNARGSWKAVLDGGTRLELGRGEPEAIVTRAQHFASTVPTLALRYGQREIETADLRYPNGYALRMRGVTTLTAPPPARPAPPTTR
ncbi:cell division protein FtsQ/DivIB [Tepidicella baoligensis]|uniref:cell division protein FtsQ/DivIB n=1 Tax=Tepidicella baoligensis TaxID=2707016 RepID=UPI0015DA7F8F|nr:cell division protein FtsQ/DivIB [Tepidicella baoligensis]